VTTYIAQVADGSKHDSLMVADSMFLLPVLGVRV